MDISTFVGINNVSTAPRLGEGELTAALNVDLDATGAIVSRRGRQRIRLLCAHSLYQAPFGLLAVIEADLVLMAPDGSTLTTISFALGFTRVWYATLADGRVVFSNGLITGITDGTAAQPWGVPAPAESGATATGDTPYWLTYVRLTDGLEGGPRFCTPATVGAPIVGLPQRDGYSINVYYALNGIAGFLAGSTLTDAFTFTGVPADMVQPCLTEYLTPPPAMRCLSAWNARVIGAVGNVLFATQPFSFEQHNPGTDYLQLDGDITFLYGCNSGIWAGTTRGLSFLRGEALATLTHTAVRAGPVVLGSGAEANLSLLVPDARPGGAQSGSFCISDGAVYLCGDSGASVAFGANQYKTSFTEVVATTRVRDGVLQYLASA